MSSEKLIQSKQPCPKCSSSDAYHVYSDGGYCFSCGESVKPLSDTSGKENYDVIGWRGVTSTTMRKYNVSTKIIDGVADSIFYPYGPKAAKVRKLTAKEFYCTGSMKEANPLFGMDVFDAGSRRSVTITEGELDAMSAHQMMGARFPCVSVKSASDAKKSCTEAFDYLNSFATIVLCFDNDEPGQKAAKEVASLFDVSKVKIMSMRKFKDANDYLNNECKDDFANAWWAAKPYLPDGVISDYSSIEDVYKEKQKTALATFPFKKLQDMTYGMRGSEIVLLTAQEKIGKTEVMGKLEHHVLTTTDHNVGIIHLEEGKRRTIDRLVTYETDVPCHLPDSSLSTEDKINAYKKLTKSDNRCFIYSHFGSDNPDTILSIIRYLVSACGCKFVFLDHITMLVTGLETDDERRKLDYISTKMAQMVNELDFCLVLVSHVNDAGQTRGSRNISKIANTRVHIERKKESELEEERLTTYLTLVDNRFASQTGPAGRLKFDMSTFKLDEVEEIE